MLETICRDCGARYPLGQDHACPKRPAKGSTAGVHRPAPRSSDGRAIPKTGDAASKEQVPGSNPGVGARKGASTKSISKGAHATGDDRHSPVAAGQKEPGPSTKPPALKAAAPVPQKKRGRKPTGFDKHEFNRLYMRQRRAAQTVCIAAGVVPSNDMIKLVMANSFDPVQLAAHLKAQKESVK